MKVDVEEIKRLFKRFAYIFPLRTWQNDPNQIKLKNLFGWLLGLTVTSILLPQYRVYIIMVLGFFLYWIVIMVDEECI